MKDLTPLPGRLGPMEGTSHDKISVLQIQRPKSSLVHAYANVRFYRLAFDATGVHRRTCRRLLTSPTFVSPAKPICAPTALRHDRRPARWGCAHPCLVGDHVSADHGGLQGSKSRKLACSRRPQPARPRPAPRKSLAKRPLLQAFHRRPRHSTRRGRAGDDHRADFGRDHWPRGPTDSRFSPEGHNRNAVRCPLDP
jgi:hypothetical protein